MKRFKSFIICSALSLSCLTLSACSMSKTVTGEMHYNEYDTEFGVKVNVKVKDGVIKKVTIAQSDYVMASPDDSGWDSTEWDNNLNSLLSAYNGKRVEDILSKEVAKEGEKPLVKGDEGFIDYGEEFIISGATLGSGRLMLAVQNALSKL
ncbi:MAG: FMN-binding protein [Candidatus Coproplasma sp.]